MDGVERIRSVLKADGLLVYDPGNHPDKCKAPYVVVRQMGTYASIQSRLTGYTLAQVYVYVPLDAYGQLTGLAARVKQLLAPLHRQLRPTGHESPDMIEEEYRAHSRSIEYQILKPLKE